MRMAPDIAIGMPNVEKKNICQLIDSKGQDWQEQKRVSSHAYTFRVVSSHQDIGSVLRFP